jgi:23S rRNA (adenine2030-N6)-methyltransferase
VLSYQHDYHAGNHADVLKHSVLAILVRALQRKPGAIRVIDSHAGSGAYDLQAALAQRGREFQRGIAPLMAAPDPPPVIEPYLEAVRGMNPDGQLRYYPGSPQVAHALLREQDRLELFELHPQAAAALQARFHRQSQVHVHRRDGFEGMPAVVPPRERRGIVLIDPAYERQSEYGEVAAAVAAAFKRWGTGVFMIWYPVIDRPGSAGLITRLMELKLPKLYRVELQPEPRAPGLRGSGVIVANLPFQVDAELERLLPWLLRCLGAEAEGTSRAEWLG